MMWTPELWHWSSPIWWVVGLILVVYFLACRPVQPSRLIPLLLGLLFASMAKASGCANIRTACHEVDGARGVA